MLQFRQASWKLHSSGNNLVGDRHKHLSPKGLFFWAQKKWFLYETSTNSQGTTIHKISLPVSLRHTQNHHLSNVFVSQGYKIRTFSISLTKVCICYNENWFYTFDIKCDLFQFWPEYKYCSWWMYNFWIMLSANK